MTKAPIASYRHTYILSGILIAIAIVGAISHHNAMTAPSPDPASHVMLYASVLLAEAGLFYYVYKAGLRPFGTPLSELVEKPSRSAEVARDVAIAIALWGAWLILQRLLALILPGDDNTVSTLLPHGVADSVLWVVLSCAAGIAEEFVFRGYLLRQYAALTQSAAAGIVLQAVLFGVSHGYQGVAACARITCYGLLFGVVARSRRNLRGCMIAHAWTDIAAGLLRI